MSTLLEEVDSYQLIHVTRRQIITFLNVQHVLIGLFIFVAFSDHLLSLMAGKLNPLHYQSKWGRGACKTVQNQAAGLDFSESN